MDKIAANIIIWTVSNVFNPAILYLYGWRPVNEVLKGLKWQIWIDPTDGRKYDKEIAIQLCEIRIGK